MALELLAQLAPLWDFFKTVVPWLTGGLAGALLTYFLNQRSSRRKQVHLRIRSEVVEYSVPARDEELKSLRVFYKGKPFENLGLFQFNVENISSKTTKTAPFLLTLNKSSEIIDRSSLVEPIKKETLWMPQSDQVGVYIWDAGELKPGDSARLRLLISPDANIKWLWRGDDEVRTSSSGEDSKQEFERELTGILLWVGAFLLAGAVPIVGAVTQAGLVIFSASKIARLFLQWRAISDLKRTSQLPSITIAGSRNAVSISTDSASARSDTIGVGSPLDAETLPK